MLYFKYTVPAFIFFAAIIGFTKWGEIKKSYWSTFPFYLIIISILEVSRYIFYWMKIPTLKTFIGLVVVPFEFLFFFWLFYMNSQKKLPIIIGSVVYVIAFLIEIFWVDTMKSSYFMSFSYSIGNIILLIFILQYFYKLIYSDRILNFYHERMFWVSLGLLVFFLGTLPYFGLYNLMLYKYFDLLVSYTWVEIFLNYTMYLLFAASFIWGEKEK